METKENMSPAVPEDTQPEAIIIRLLDKKETTGLSAASD
jgi:hypothetical protein